MRWRLWETAILCTIFLLSIPSVVAEDSIPPNKAICTAEGGKSFVDPMKFIRWAIRKYSLTDEMLDVNGDGDTLLSEKQIVLSNSDFCKSEDKSNNGRCNKEDVDAVGEYHNNTTFFLGKSVWPGRYKIVHIRDPWDDEIQESPHLEFVNKYLKNQNKVQKSYIVSIGRKFAAIECLHLRKKKPEIQNAGAGKADPSGADDDEAPLIIKPVLRGDSDNLVLSLKKGEAANFSISTDLNAGTREYQISGAAGLSFEQTETYRRFSGIPYVAYDRRFTTGGNSGKSTEVNNIEFGIIGAAAFLTNELGVQAFSLTSKFVTDSEANTRIGALEFIATPTPDWPTVGRYDQIGQIGFLRFRTRFDARVNLGSVFDDGGRTELRGTNDYARIGGRVILDIRGHGNDILERFRLLTSFKYFRQLSGKPRDIPRLESTLSFSLTKDKHATLELKYRDGRVDETLEDEKSWFLGLGLKF